jgi:beta-N-acetylhexosaminidase
MATPCQPGPTVPALRPGSRALPVASPTWLGRPMATDDSARRRLALGVVMGCFEGTELPAWVRRDLADGLGSLCLFGSNLTGDDAQAAALVAQVHDVAPGCVVALDEEGGDVTRLDYAHGSRTVGAAVLGAVDEEGLTRAVLRDLGARLAAVGVDLDLAPVLDVNSAPDNPVIGTRSFGADPGLVARHGVAAVRGMADAGVAVCLKHFPGHGDTVTDSHVAAPLVRADGEQLRSRELVPFAAAVAAGADAVMTAHVRVPEIDRDQPASTSAAVVRLLREELGFAGVVVTDALDMVGVSGPQAHGSVEAAAVASLLAGADLLCLGADWSKERVHSVVGAVVAAVADGTLPPERLEQAADRVRRLGRTCAHRRSARTGTGVHLDRTSAAAGRVRDAAAAAITVRGTVPPLARALVVRLDEHANAAVGAVPWGLADALAELVDDVEATDAHPDEPSATLLAAADGRPLVVVARDTHRSPGVRRWLGQLFARRPDAVLVDLGWPADTTPVPPGGALVRALGASPASARAVVERLARP